MKSYLSGNAVVHKVALLDNEGQAFTASAASYRVIDENGGVVQGPAAIAPWTGTETEASVTVTGGNNTLAGAATRGLRRVEVTFTTAAGTVVLESGYLIEALEPLVVPTNSFMTYGQATMSAAGQVNMTAWNAASKADRVNAMMVARDNLCALSYRWESLADPMRYIEPEFAVQDLSLLTSDEYLALSEEFRAALGRAQVIQANHLLGGDEVAKWRERGLMSMTVGETSQMFRPGKPLKLAVCEDALRVIGRYVRYSKRIARN